MMFVDGKELKLVCAREKTEIQYQESMYHSADRFCKVIDVEECMNDECKFNMQADCNNCDTLDMMRDEHDVLREIIAEFEQKNTTQQATIDELRSEISELQHIVERLEKEKLAHQNTIKDLQFEIRVCSSDG